MRRPLPELSAFAIASAIAIGVARAATSDAETVPVRDTVAEAADLQARPSAHLLLAQSPREVAFVLDGPSNPVFPMLLGARDPSVERHGPMRLYLSGRWGQWATRPWREHEWLPLLSPGDDVVAEAAAAGDRERVRSEAPTELGLSSLAGVILDASSRAHASLPLVEAMRDRRWMGAHAWGPGATLFDSTGPGLRGNGFDSLYALPPDKPVRDWRCQRRPVTIVRYGAESDAVELVRCDGSMVPEALDRLTILARPPETPRPEVLPDEPDRDAWSARHEWLPNVRLVHPRLVWALQQIADAFPRRAMYVFSGYRPMARVGGGRLDDGDGEAVGHRSLHADGRALDLSVHGIPNEEVFKACRKLADVGCGFYPNSKFVHVDVRPARTGKAFWIDTSAPGEPPRYVDAWPGVVESGAMSWVPEGSRVRP